VKGSANGTGGKKITEWEVAWGTNPSHVQHTANLNLDGTGYVSGLTPGQQYYFWNRVKNADGWSIYSARTSVITKDVPDKPAAPIPSSKTQTSVKINVKPNGNGGSTILGYTLYYGLSPTSASSSVSGGPSGVFQLDNLDPGKTYYLWAEATNTWGDSDLSARSQVTLIAGAWVRQGFVWKRAVPYVKVNGVWKLTRAWVKVAGVWKETND
jgi:hypothetical protein